MDQIHHVAITVNDIEQSIAWYDERFDFEIEWQDQSWALLKFANISLALVLPEQHPPHVAFVTPEPEKYGKPVPHRDGTASVYIKDCNDNFVEMLSVPKAANT